MNRIVVILLCIAALLSGQGLASAQAVSDSQRNLSLKLEIESTIARGSNWLVNQQNKKGWWSNQEYPAITALALTALHGVPSGKYRQSPTDGMERAYRFLLTNQKPDGGIYAEGYANYNTAVSMMGLLTAGNSRFDESLRKARAYLVGSQNDFGEKGKLDTPVDGGVGYGRRYPHSDLNNTLIALEALHYSRHLVKDSGDAHGKDLDWKAAIRFLENTQNSPAKGKSDPVSEFPEDQGGFYYYPGFSQAGARTNSQTGRISLRSYGSASYAGMLSYVYADLKKDDPRVQSVLTWLNANFTLAENPGMGPQGLYYYFQLMTKALSTAGVNELKTRDGQSIDWRRQLALRLLNLQKRDGSWVNDNGRWMETDPVLVTSYSLIALEMIWREL